MATKAKPKPTIRGTLKKFNNKVIELMALKEQIDELVDEKIEEIESKADDRESGELTEKEDERIEELGDLKGTLEDDWDLDTLEW